MKLYLIDASELAHSAKDLDALTLKSRAHYIGNVVSNAIRQSPIYQETALEEHRRTHSKLTLNCLLEPKFTNSEYISWAVSNPINMWVISHLAYRLYDEIDARGFKQPYNYNFHLLVGNMIDNIAHTLNIARLHTSSSGLISDLGVEFPEGKGLSVVEYVAKCRAELIEKWKKLITEQFVYSNKYRRWKADNTLVKPRRTGALNFRLYRGYIESKGMKPEKRERIMPNWAYDEILIHLAEVAKTDTYNPFKVSDKKSTVFE